MICREPDAGMADNATARAPDDDSFRSDVEGMSLETARIAIDRRIREKLFNEYDLLKLKDEGRYIVAQARSKDGKMICELMVDKLSGIVRVYDRRFAHRE